MSTLIPLWAMSWWFSTDWDLSTTSSTKRQGVYKVPLYGPSGKNIKLWRREWNFRAFRKSLMWKRVRDSNIIYKILRLFWEKYIEGKGRKFWGRKSRFLRHRGRERISSCMELYTPLPKGRTVLRQTNKTEPQGSRKKSYFFSGPTTKEKKLFPIYLYILAQKLWRFFLSKSVSG